MNRRDWQNRLRRLRRKEKQADERLISKRLAVEHEEIHLMGLRSDIADCLANIESIKQREKLARKDIRYGAK